MAYMTSVRNAPWSAFERFNNELNNLVSRQWPTGPDNDDSQVVTGRWAPAVDIREEPNRFVLTADIPGVDPKDIDITMENSVLTIRGERRQESRGERQGYQRIERVHGTFYRRFSLPDSADEQRISAKGEHGVLTIAIPKKEKAQPRRIAVNK